MPKRFKIKIKLSSFQLCRSKESPCLSQKQTLESLFSHKNPKAFDISCPRVPEPPPTTPDHPTPNHQSSMARIAPISLPNSQEEERRNRYVLHNSPAFDVSDSDTSVVTRLKRGKNMKVKTSACAITPPIDSGWFSGEDSDSLYSARSFSSSCDFGYPLETISEDSTEGGKERNIFAKNLISSNNSRVKESVTVVKRSENPCKDFKSSMLEMIMEKEMYDVKDLEQLLQSFLSLNSAHYHGAIVEAFAEVWGDLFGETRNSARANKGADTRRQCREIK